MQRIEGAESYMTSFLLPIDLRGRLDVLRMARAHREGRLPPPLRSIILEALESLVERELGRARR
jgi:hypothetical protein